VDRGLPQEEKSPGRLPIAAYRPVGKPEVTCPPTEGSGIT
jgi:hypothetical protein